MARVESFEHDAEIENFFLINLESFLNHSLQSQPHPHYYHNCHLPLTYTNLLTLLKIIDNLSEISKAWLPHWMDNNFGVEDFSEFGIESTFRLSIDQICIDFLKISFLLTLLEIPLPMQGFEFEKSFQFKSLCDQTKQLLITKNLLDSWPKNFCGIFLGLNISWLGMIEYKAEGHEYFHWDFCSPDVCVGTSMPTTSNLRRLHSLMMITSQSIMKVANEKFESCITQKSFLFKNWCQVGNIKALKKL